MPNSFCKRLSAGKNVTLQVIDHSHVKQHAAWHGDARNGSESGRPSPQARGYLPELLQKAGIYNKLPCYQEEIIMDHSPSMKFIMLRANAELKAAHSDALGIEHIFLALLKLAEIHAADFISAPENVLAVIDEDICQVKKKFEENHIDTTRTRGHLRYMIAGGVAADEFALEQCTKLAEKKAKAEKKDMLWAADMLEVIIKHPSDLMLQVCSLKREEPEDGGEVEEMSIDFLPVLTSRIRKMRARLLSVVYGQDHVVHGFAEGMFAAELLAASDEKRRRPRAVFVFAGPPGVGKTFLAEQAAEGLDMPFRRFDMSSYADHQSYMGLVGFEKSYQGAKRGTLTGFVKAHSHSILLFDEIEKAHANTINLFLQILDGGRLFDRFLEEDISFKDTIIIFTTNAGRFLYERNIGPGGVAVSRAAVLSALETEINPRTGRPFFPETITSRMATGWPLLFNHLQTHHLEKISRNEFARMGSLFEKQYGIHVQVDDFVPVSLLLQEGGQADARTLRAQSELFFKNEVFKICRLWGEENFSSALSKIRKIRFVVQTESFSDQVRTLFEQSKRPEILLYGTPGFARKCAEELAEYEIYSTQSVQEALMIAGEKDIRLALIDIAEKSVEKNPVNLIKKSYMAQGEGTIMVNRQGAFDFAPMAAAAIHDGSLLFKSLHERLPNLPIYLLETEALPIDLELEMSFVRAGARGKLTAPGDDFSVFEDMLSSLCRELRIQGVASRLASERKVLSFETAPKMSSDQSEVMIRLRDFTLRRAVSADDSSSVLDDVEKPSVRFADVVGARQAKEELRFFIQYLKNPRPFSVQGMQPPKGVLLYGPPGTGKTMLARAMAGESDVAFIPFVATSFVTKYQGSGPEAVRDLFRRARKYAPAVIFIDEIDAIGRKRGQINSGHGEEMALNALLAEMDGFVQDPQRPIFVLAATNFDIEDGQGGMGVIDPALSRRFSCKISVDLPNQEEREQLLRLLVSRNKIHVVSHEMLKRLASRSVGMSPSALTSVVEQANRLAMKGQTILDDELLDEAYETTKHGSQKTWGYEYLERVARHESGHGLICHLCGREPAYLTIVARGDHGGYMEHSPQEEGHISTKEDLLNRIRISLGGRAAEIVYYGEEGGLSTGASGDLAQATKIAQAMICSYGMDEEFGLGVRDGKDGETAEVKKKINQILDREMRKTVGLIRENRHLSDRLAEALLKENKLTGEQIKELW